MVSLSSIYNWIKDAFKEAEKAADRAKDAVHGIDKARDAIADLPGKIQDRVTKSFDVVSKTVNKGFDSMTKGVRNLEKAISTQLKGFDLTSGLSGLTKLAEKVVDFFISDLPKWSKKAIDWIDTNYNNARKKLEKFWAALIAAWTKVTESWRWFWDHIWYIAIGAGVVGGIILGIYWYGFTHKTITISRRSVQRLKSYRFN